MNQSTVRTDAARTDPARTDPVRFVLTDEEVAAAVAAVDRVAARFPSAEDPEFLREATAEAQELPRRLRAFLGDVRLLETAAASVVSGFPVDDAGVGPTPASWSLQPDRRSTLREEIWLVLCASLLGDVFGWATQQGGALVHDICPARGYEQSQLGSGSAELLWWHTEEAFHPHKCDYLGLLSLRNHDLVPTTFSSIAGVELDAEVRDVLFQRRFRIRPDDSHLEEDREPELPPGKQGALMHAARKRIERMNANPELVSVLYGDPDSPYVAIDPFYMEMPEGDPEAGHALETITKLIDGRVQDLALAPGEILFIDNFRAVHGRKPFQARYDGTDRWLKRVNIARDLRRSRDRRVSSDARIIH